MKHRKLKKIDEYLEVIPAAWKIYQHELTLGTDFRKAELKAVKMLYPGDKNSSTTLNIWKKYGLWPPPKEVLNGGDIGDDYSRIQGRNGLRFIRGGAGKVRRLIASEELSDKEILRRVGKILDTIEVHKRQPGTGGRRKIYSTVKTRVIADRMPVDLLNEIHKFRGSNTHHLERALRLYVKVMRARD